MNFLRKSSWIKISTIKTVLGHCSLPWFFEEKEFQEKLGSGNSIEEEKSKERQEACFSRRLLRVKSKRLANQKNIEKINKVAVFPATCEIIKSL